MSDELVRRILADPDVIPDPYPLLRELRETSPVHRSGFSDAWILTRFEDCRAALNDPRFGSPESGEEVRSLMESSSELMPERTRSLPYLNPPEHTRVRSQVSRAFSPSRVERLRSAVKTMTNELLDDVAGSGECDLVEALAFPLPANVISELVGIPAEDRDWLRPLVTDVSALLEPNLQPLERAQAAASEAKVYEYLEQLIQHKQAEPADDLLSALLAPDNGEDRLTLQEVAVMILLIYAAGFETTTILISNTVLTLLRHPDQLARLRADRSLVSSAVDEVLRFEPPVQIDGRFVRADAEIGGQTIPQGHRVLLMLGAANRDPAVVDEPERFDVGRRDVPMLSFAYGIHYCLGAALARVEGQVVLEALLDGFNTWTLLDDNPPWIPRIGLRGLSQLPVSLS